MGLYTRTRKRMLKGFLRQQHAKQALQWEKLFGDFDSADYEYFRAANLPNESGFYHGEIIKWAGDLDPGEVLFIGENNLTAAHLKTLLHAKAVFTAGLTDTDYTWNFEQPPPMAEKKFDLIISQAVLEHLIDPCRHFYDISTLVKNNGRIIIHTVLPGFRYHRYPIDAVRFFPDWFETAADRLGLTVLKRRIKAYHMFYMFGKIAGSGS
ncbi:MAG: methyltransferase domain-containing protein [Desulfobacterales bacterium]